MAYRLISRSRYPIGNIEVYSGLSIIVKSLQNKGDSIETDKLTDRIRSLHNMDMISIVDLSVDNERGVTPEENYDIKVPEDIVDQEEYIDNNLNTETNTDEESETPSDNTTEDEVNDTTPDSNESESDAVIPEEPENVTPDNSDESVDDESTDEVSQLPEDETPSDNTSDEESNTNSDEVVPDEVINEDETSKVDEEQPEEVINEESSNEDVVNNEPEVISIQDQLASSSNGDTITLMEDTHLTEALVIDKDITINLNGHKLSSDGDVLDISANVTINGDGEVTGGSGGNYVTVYARTGNITINGGTYSVGADAEGSGNSTIYVNGDAVVTINGGHFSTEVPYNNFYYVLNKKNGTEGTFVVNGGTFVGYNPANGDDAEGGSFLADGTESVDLGDNVYEVKAVEVATGSKRRRRTSTK